MAQFVTLPTANKNWWEPAANQASNFLWQMGLATAARQMRLRESMAEKAYEMEEESRKTQNKLSMAGYQVLPENATPGPGTIKVDGKLYKPPDPIALRDGDKLLGYAYRDINGTVIVKPQKEDEGPKSGYIPLYEKEVEQAEAGVGQHPGPFGPWLLRQRKAGAIRLGIEEKVETKQAMEDVDRKSFIQTASWDKEIAAVTKTKFTNDEWTDMSGWRREKEIFDTADTDVKNVYKDWQPLFATRGNVQGWFGKNPKTGKFELIKRWGKEKEPDIPEKPVGSRVYNESQVVRKKF